MSHEIFMEEKVLRMFQGSFKECFKEVSKVFQGRFKGVSGKFQKCFMLHGTHRSFPSRRRACFQSEHIVKCMGETIFSLE